MKAKEQAKMYLESCDKKAAIKLIVEDYIVSFCDTVVARNIGTSESLYSLVEEMNDKWKKFISLAGLTDTLKPSTFINRLNALIKEINDGRSYGLWAGMMNRYGHRFE